MIERWTIKIKEGLTGEGLEVRAWTDKDGEFVLYEDFLKLKKEFDDYKYLVDNTPFGHWKQRAEQAEEQVERLKCCQSCGKVLPRDCNGCIRLGES